MTAPARLGALDGLRGLALAGMLAWHAEVSWVKGGFARMTIFFVLAGFLAARSLTSARDRGARRPFLEFWGRRARRLFPVSALGVAAAVAATAAWGGPESARSAFGDAVASLTSWSNWRFVAADRSYGAMFEHPSAFQHYWSLSLEEQAFVALPAVLAVASLVAGTRPGRHRRTAVVVAAIGAVLCALPLVWLQGPDTVYYGTHTRGGEFLLGSALALWWRGRTAPARAASTNRAPNDAAWRIAGALGLAVLVVVMLSLDRTAAWLYRGGMGLFAIPAVAVIGAVLTGAGPATRVLEVAPLRVLGRWAFPVYALHWPIFLGFRAELPHWPHWRVVVVEMALSIAIGGLVHVFFERPLMPGGTSWVGRAWARPRIAAPSAVVAGVTVLVAAAAVPPVEPAIDFEAAVEQQPGLTSEDAVAILSEVEDATELPGSSDQGLTDEAAAAILSAEGAGNDELAFRLPDTRAVALFGGSTALTLALGAGPWESSTDGYQFIPGYSSLGCGLLTQGVRGFAGVPQDDALSPRRPEAPCLDRTLRWAAAAKLRQVDVAIVVASQMDMADWRLDGSDRWRSVGDPEIDETLRNELRETIERFTQVGVQRILLTTAVQPSDVDEAGFDLLDEERAAAYDAVVRSVAAELGVGVLELGEWTQDLSIKAFRRCFPDGWHPTERCAEQIWTELVGPAAVTALEG